MLIDLCVTAVPKNEIDDDGDDGNNHHGDAGNERDDNAYDNEDFTFTDEQQPPVETKTNEENSGDGLMTRTGNKALFHGSFFLRAALLTERINEVDNEKYILIENINVHLCSGHRMKHCS